MKDAFHVEGSRNRRMDVGCSDLKDILKVVSSTEMSMDQAGASGLGKEGNGV